MDAILAANVQSVQQVGKARAQKLNKLGIKTIGDLVTLHHGDYEDRNMEKRVSELADAMNARSPLRVLSEYP